MGIALAIAVLLAGTSAIRTYAEFETDSAEVNAEESSDTLWKAEISDYDSSLSLVQYEEITPSEESTAVTEQASSLETAQSDDAAAEESAVSYETETLSSSNGSGSVDTGTAVSLGAPESGQFAFTTYGYGHCVGLSQNGANYYASYGGYDYQSILFHYYPGTTLVQEDLNAAVDGIDDMVSVLSQIVYNEMSSTMHPEAMKAQAVAVYTYIMFNGGSTDGLILKEDPPQNVIDAVSFVVGQALYYDGDYAMTVFTASSGGATANSGDIFGTTYPYLVSVPCEYDASYDPNYGEVTYLSVDEVRSRIQNAYGVSLSDNSANWIQLEVGDSGYVRSVNIDGQKTVNGDEFRSALGLKSACFAYCCG